MATPEKQPTGILAGGDSDHSDPNEFTDREKFLAGHIRETDLTRSPWLTGYDLAFIVGSVICLILAVVREEVALAFVAYALVVGRLSYNVVEGNKIAREWQTILRKYHAKLKAAEAQNLKKRVD